MSGRPKSKYKEICNRCGICCSLEICPAGEIAFPNAEPPCPALAYEIEDLAICRFISIEENTCTDRIIAKALGIGCGCSMPDKKTTKEEIKEFNSQSYYKLFGAGDIY